MIKNSNYENSPLNPSTSKWSARDGLTFLLVGSGIGAVLALLFAPKSGREMRTDIADASRRGYDLTVEKATALRDQSTETLKGFKEKAEGVYDMAASKLTAGSEAIADAASNASTALSEEVGAVKENLDGRSKSTSIGRKSASIF